MWDHTRRLILGPHKAHMNSSNGVMDLARAWLGNLSGIRHHGQVNAIFITHFHHSE